MSRDPMPDVIVLLPGITGSRLRRGSKTVWGVTGKVLGSTLLSGGASLCRDLNLAEDPPGIDDPADGIVADSLIQDLHLLPGYWKIDGYTKVADTIRAVFEVEDQVNFFQFPYDWRRDNRLAARRLAAQCHSWLNAWRARSGNQDARLILLAHSMGGLVAQYFIECLEGWKVTRALLTFGTPFRGSLNALGALGNGLAFGPGDLIDLTPAIRSFTSSYQLLPIYPCYDAGDGRLIRLVEAVAPPVDPAHPGAAIETLRQALAKNDLRHGALPNIDAAKLVDAVIFHYEMLAAAAARAGGEEDRPPACRVFPVIGISQITGQSARLEGAAIRIDTHYQDRDLKGDGTVPRVSAEPAGRTVSRDAMFAATKHASLQNADAVLTQLRGVLNSLYLDLGAFLAAPAQAVRVALGGVPDLAWEGDPIVVHALPETDAPVALLAIVEGDDPARTVPAIPLHPAGEGRQEAVLPPLPPGNYRIRITGGDTPVEPAEDCFAVVARRIAA